MQARFSTPSSLAAHHRRLMASCAESGCPQVRQTSGPKLSARTVGESLCMSKSIEAHYKGHCEDQGPTNRMSAAMFSGRPTVRAPRSLTEPSTKSHQKQATKRPERERLTDAAVVCCGRSGRRRCQRAVVEDVPADRASTLLVIKDQLSNLRGNSFSLPVSFPNAC